MSGILGEPELRDAPPGPGTRRRTRSSSGPVRPAVRPHDTHLDTLGALNYANARANPNAPDPFKAYHPFDGDGMLHFVGFRDGKSFYRNSFIRIDGFLAENLANHRSPTPAAASAISST